MMATHSMGSILRLYSRIWARSPWLDLWSLDYVNGLSSGRWLSYVILRCGLAEQDSVESDIERDVGCLSSPWYGCLGRSSERELLDEE